MWRVKMAWEREDWAFMLVLPTVRERAPRWRHARVWSESGAHNVYHYYTYPSAIPYYKLVYGIFVYTTITSMVYGIFVILPTVWERAPR
jgi:hypothetical protein